MSDLAVTSEVALARARSAIMEHELSALVALSHTSTLYAAGTAFLTQRSLRERLALVVIVPDSDPVLIYESIEEEHAKTESWIKDVRRYTEHVDQPIRILADVLKEKGVGDGRIGLESLFLSWHHYEELRHELPDAELIDADAIFQQMRAIKSPAEIRILGENAAATDVAIRIAYEAAHVGDTEMSIADRMLAEVAARGSTGRLACIVATGPNAVKAHHMPGLTKLEPSTILRCDFSAIWGYYPSDIARTAIVGPALPHQLDTLMKLEDVQQTIVSKMKPGVRAGDLYRICVSECERRNLTFRWPHIGHTLTVNVDNFHELPVLQPFDDNVLQPGMLIALEPLVIGRDAKYHVEDLIEITETGARFLSRPNDWSQPLIVG